MYMYIPSSKSTLILHFKQILYKFASVMDNFETHYNRCKIPHVCILQIYKRMEFYTFFKKMAEATYNMYGKL